MIVWKPASTASGRRVYKLGKPLCENQPVGRCAIEHQNFTGTTSRRWRGALEIRPPHRHFHAQWAIQDFTALFRQGAEAARAADGDGAPGQGLAHEGPAGTLHYRSTYCECCGFSYQGPQWGWDRASSAGLAKVFACDVCGSAMRAPVVESHAGKVVEGPAAGKAVIERAAQSCELTRSSHKSDALYVVAEAEGEYEVKGLGRGTTSAISGNRTANFDAATLDRFKARSERIIYEQCLGDAVTESNRGSTLQQAGNVHSQTPHFSKPPEVNGRVEIKLPRHRCDN